MPTVVLMECAAVVVVAIAVGIVAYRYARRRSFATLFAIVSLAWLVADAIWLRGSVRLLRWIPWQDFIVLADFTPFAAAILIG